MKHKFLSSFLSRLEHYGEEFEFVAERFYSRVYRIPGRVIKIITPHHVLRPEGFASRSEASAFMTEILTYMEKVAALGVSVPSLEDTHAVISSAHTTNEPFILMDVPDGGISVEKSMECAESSPDFLRGLAQEMVYAMRCVFRQSRLPDGCQEVGIDPIASNFVFHNKNLATMQYVDFTAPRYFSPHYGYRVEYPQPANEAEIREAVWRYYEPCGIITRWLTDCCRIRPDARGIFLDVLKKMLPDELWRSAKSQLQSLHLPPDIRTSEWRHAISEVRQLADFRDLACAIAAADGTNAVGTQKWLSEFFIASRHHAGQPLPDEKLAALKRQLFDRLESA